MKTIVINLGYGVINVIGSGLIFLAQFISVMRSIMFTIIFFAIVIGIFIAISIALFDLLGLVVPTTEMTLNVYGAWYWDVIVLVLGSITIGLCMKNI